MNQQDLERIARAALRELGVPNADMTLTEEAGRPGYWCINLRGGGGPDRLRIRCSEGTTAGFVREQVFQQFTA